MELWVCFFCTFKDVLEGFVVGNQWIAQLILTGLSNVSSDTLSLMSVVNSFPCHLLLKPVQRAQTLHCTVHNLRLKMTFLPDFSSLIDCPYLSSKACIIVFKLLTILNSACMNYPIIEHNKPFSTFWGQMWDKCPQIQWNYTFISEPTRTIIFHGLLDWSQYGASRHYI